jgi:hypothetical protein
MAFSSRTLVAAIILISLTGGFARAQRDSTNSNIHYDVDGSETRIGNVTDGCCGGQQIPSGDFRGVITEWDTDSAFFGLRDYGDDSKDVVINNEQGSDDIRFQSSGRDLAIIEGENGRVGVGTTSPGKKLSVNGPARAKEVIVEQSGWPDFVFTDA